MIDAAERDPVLSRLHVELVGRRRAPLCRALERAGERGELAPTVDIELTADLLIAPAFYRRFFSHRPLSDGDTLAIIDGVLVVAAAARPAADG